MGRPIKGFGTYFYPPIKYEEDEANYQFDSYEIYVRKNGYIAINNENEDETEDIFNAIFLSTSLIKAYTVLRVHRKEFEEINITATGKYFSSRTFLTDSKIGSLILSNIFYMRPLIKKFEFEKIIELAELIFKSKFKVGIFSFYDCLSKLSNGDFTGSFIMSWTAIEYYLSRRLENYFLNNNVFQELITKINREWSIFKKLDYLKENGEIDTPEFNSYNDQRMIRNRIIHSDYRPSEHESNECKDVSSSIMWKLFEMEGIDYSSIYNKIYPPSS